MDRGWTGAGQGFVGWTGVWTGVFWAGQDLDRGWWYRQQQIPAASISETYFVGACGWPSLLFVVTVPAASTFLLSLVFGAGTSFIPLSGACGDHRIKQKKQQATNNTQHRTHNTQQTANNKQQPTNNKQQTRRFGPLRL